MSAIQDLSAIIREGLPSGVNRDELSKSSREAMEKLFGERYHARSPHAERVALMPAEDAVSFAGFVHPDSPTSGVYGGMSLIWFPTTSDEEREPASLLTFVCGTRGLSPDEHILGRPGHARYLRALRRYLGHLGVPVWAKYDPTDLNHPVPEIAQKQFPSFSSAFKRYGNYIYCCAAVPRDPELAEQVVKAFLDLYAWERGWAVSSAAKKESQELLSSLRAQLFERTDRPRLVQLIQDRRFVIIEGPPGTGKSRLANEVLREDFQECGMVVQFHPAVTYETFVAGITPDVKDRNLRFGVSPGWLVQAIQNASNKFLLVIDEINRGDLGRVLGEAIYLFESDEISRGESRTVVLPQPLEDGTRELRMPQNLYVLGTMNSADRSIAILDLAVRRRFAFVPLWPDLNVVAAQELALATDAFERLLDIFTQYAPDDSLPLMPGHSYFLADNVSHLVPRLRYELLPLLGEYLQEGRLGACETEIRAYVDWLEGELTNNASVG